MFGLCLSNAITDLEEFSEALICFKEVLAVLIKYDVYKENFDPEKVQLGHFSQATLRCVEQLSFVCECAHTKKSNEAVQGQSFWASVFSSAHKK